MTGYTKLFGSIITSTIWREKNETRILWITMLALKNKAGIVEGSVPGLADMARLSLEDTLAALAILRDPDPYSRSKEFEGRRIVDVDGGWLILNHEKWRAKMNTDERREYLKVKQREHRARVNKSVNKRKQKSTESTHTDTDTKADTDTDTDKRKPLSLSDCIDYAKTIGIQQGDATAFYDSQESGGWTRGGRALKNWQAALRTWKANGWLPSQKQANGQRQFTRPKEKAPHYPAMTESREATEAEYEKARKIAAEEKAKLREQLSK